MSNGTGVNIDTMIGDTSDMSASGCGRENFINTMGIPENIQENNVAILGIKQINFVLSCYR